MTALLAATPAAVTHSHVASRHTDSRPPRGHYQTRHRPFSRCIIPRRRSGRHHPDVIAATGRPATRPRARDSRSPCSGTRRRAPRRNHRRRERCTSTEDRRVSPRRRGGPRRPGAKTATGQHGVRTRAHDSRSPYSGTRRCAPRRNHRRRGRCTSTEGRRVSPRRRGDPRRPGAKTATGRHGVRPRARNNRRHYSGRRRYAPWLTRHQRERCASMENRRVLPHRHSDPSRPDPKIVTGRTTVRPGARSARNHYSGIRRCARPTARRQPERCANVESQSGQSPLPRNTIAVAIAATTAVPAKTARNLSSTWSRAPLGVPGTRHNQKGVPTRPAARV